MFQKKFRASNVKADGTYKTLSFKVLKQNKRGRANKHLLCMEHAALSHTISRDLSVKTTSVKVTRINA